MFVVIAASTIIIGGSVLTGITIGGVKVITERLDRLDRLAA